MGGDAILLLASIINSIFVILIIFKIIIIISSVTRIILGSPCIILWPHLRNYFPVKKSQKKKEGGRRNKKSPNIIQLSDLMAGWLTLTLISAGFPKMTKIALIVLFHVLPILSRYQLPNEGLSLREWRLKVNSSKSPVVIASSKNLVVLYKRERERKKWDWGRMRKARRGRSWESYSLVADSHMSSRRPGLLRGGDTVLLPSQMINLQNKFSTPSRLQFRLLVFTHQTSKHVHCALI